MDARRPEWSDASAGYVLPPAPKLCEASYNVDGKCVLGGTMVPLPGEAKGWGLPAFGGAGQCAAFPLFVAQGVPYTNGDVVSKSYKELARLSSYTTLRRAFAVP